MEQQSNTDIPDFLVKTSLGVSLIAIIFVSPFCINNFIQGRHLLGSLNGITVILFSINATLCFKGIYHRNFNLFGVAFLTVIPVVYAVHTLGIIGSYWAYMGVLTLYFILPVNLAYKLNILFLLVLLPIAWNALETAIFIRFSAILIGMSIHAYISTQTITKQHFLLKQKVVTDTLTGLYNRSLLQSSLEYAIHQHDRAGTAMALLMLDIDSFKKINDQYGHYKGDTVLKSLGEFLIKYFRGSDMVFRIGGEEIMVLIHNADHVASLKIAEKLRAKIEMLNLIPDQTVTVSIGVSNLHAGMNWEDWMKQCDDNLYRAKSMGRNQVVG